MPYEKKLIPFKDRRKFRFFSNRKSVSQFVYACTVDLRTSARKVEEKPMQTTVGAVIFAWEWVFWSATYMMTSVTGSNLSLP